METRSLDDLFFGETVRRYVQAPRFIRRAWLADDLLDLLSRPSCRIVVLTGAPGAGKSGFTAQLAADHPDWLLYMLRRQRARKVVVEDRQVAGVVSLRPPCVIEACV